MHDAGILTVCGLINRAEAGAMPDMALAKVTAHYYEDRAVGYNRFYAAQGVNEQIDLVSRIWRDTSVRIGMYAVLSQSENDGQYRITNVQHLLDDDGLKVTDLTLSRIEELYDIDTSQNQEAG